MIYQKLIEAQAIIRSLLDHKDNLKGITEIINKNSNYIDVTVSDFIRSLRYISTITQDELLHYENDVFSSKETLEDVFDFIKKLDSYVKGRKFDESILVTQLINFDNYAYEIKKFVDNYRVNKRKSNPYQYQIKSILEESNKNLSAVKALREEIERVLKEIIERNNESKSALIRVHSTELRIGDLEKEINKQKNSIDSILLKAEAFKESFDNQLEAITLRREKLQTLLDSVDIDLKNNISNRLNAFDKDLEGYIREFNGKCKNVMAQNEEEFRKEKEVLFQSIHGQHNIIINDIGRFRTKILNDLHDIESAVYREQLARYFYDERRKLKGDISINFILATLLLFIAFWRQELMAVYIFDSEVVWRLPVSFVGSMIVTQIIFNIYEQKKIIWHLKESILKNNKSPNVQDEHRNNSQNAVVEKEIANDSLFEKVIFQKQIKDLLTPYWCWLIATFAGMIAIANLAVVIFQRFKNISVTYNDFLPYTAGYMLLIWFTWFCSKQFSYTKQICDEYEYKYALSKSYVSYREEARKLAEAKNDVAILIALLDSVIKNIAQSPVQNVKRDCHTPFTEVFNAVKDANSSFNRGNSKDNDN